MVQVGIVENNEEEPIIDAYIHKLGGQPIWPHGSDSGSLADKFKCQNCSRPLIFLLQIYVPDFYDSEDANDAAEFDRFVYVWVCRRKACHAQHPTKCVLVFSFSIPVNDEVKEEDESTALGSSRRRNISISRPKCPFMNMKRVCPCGLESTLMCGGCKHRSYCCNEHQKIMWEVGGHREHCKLLEGIEAEEKEIRDLANQEEEWKRAASRFVFPREHEIIVASEDSLITPVEKDAAAQAALVASNTDGEQYEKDATKVSVDKSFLSFQKRISRIPGQVLRYYRDESAATEEEDLILWPNSLRLPDLEKKYALNAGFPGTCKICSHPLEAEFQLCPQILNYLEGLDDRNNDEIDFATVIVYSCPRLRDPSVHKPMEKKGTWIRETSISLQYSKDGWNPFTSAAK